MINWIVAQKYVFFQEMETLGICKKIILCYTRCINMDDVDSGFPSASSGTYNMHWRLYSYYIAAVFKNYNCLFLLLL